MAALDDPKKKKHLPSVEGPMTTVFLLQSHTRPETSGHATINKSGRIRLYLQVGAMLGRDSGSDEARSRVLLAKNTQFATFSRLDATTSYVNKRHAFVHKSHLSKVRPREKAAA